MAIVNAKVEFLEYCKEEHISTKNFEGAFIEKPGLRPKVFKDFSTLLSYLDFEYNRKYYSNEEFDGLIIFEEVSIERRDDEGNGYWFHEVPQNTTTNRF